MSNQRRGSPRLPVYRPADVSGAGPSVASLAAAFEPVSAPAHALALWDLSGAFAGEIVSECAQLGELAHVRVLHLEEPPRPLRLASSAASFDTIRIPAREALQH